MNDKHYKWLLYVIVVVIVTTIAIQVFWNYKNYQTSKTQVFNDIQLSLDNAVESYYADISKNNFLTVIKSNDTLGYHDFNPDAWDSILKPLKPNNHHIIKDTTNTKLTSITIKTDSKFDSLDVHAISSIFEDVEKDYLDNTDSTKTKGLSKFMQLSKDRKTGLTFYKDSNIMTHNRVVWGKKARDSINLLKGLSTIFIAMQEDSLDYKKLDSIVFLELQKKGVACDFYVNHFKDNSLLYSSKKTNQPTYNLKKQAKSTYAKLNETISLNFKNPISETFKRSSIGILLSTLLILAVISCLFYLLKIIKHQKQIAEVKNDLISNITHEFKTPIATIGVALESIKDFNGLDDKEKTKNYLNMSSEQLIKLNTMVEKLLETATLDSERITLNKEDVNLVEFLNASIEKHSFLLDNKTISLKKSHNIIPANVDMFHFENAFNNIIDNAIKYGGETITVSLDKTLKTTSIIISDNGTSLTKAHKDRIFEQFYRVPKGNTHDVKGFGIGLYYAKTIVEKHQGTIVLELSKTQTTFKITLANV